MKLKIIRENNKICLLEWKDVPHSTEYIIQGLTPLFTYETIRKIDDRTALIFKDSSNIGYRIAYTHYGTVIEYSNTVMVCAGQEYRARIEPYWVKTSNGEAVSLRSDKLYDLYEVYVDAKLQYTTQDPIIFSKPNCYYTVVGYKDEGYSACCNIQAPVRINTEGRSIRLTIGIPVYNTGEFLDRALGSILASSFQDFEIILVDDSTDKKTTSICEWYKENYDFITGIHREGRPGICSARNYALDHARGEWFAFVDADDIVHPLMFEKLMNAAEEYDTDIAISQVVIRNDYESSEYLLCSDPELPVIEKSYSEILNDDKKRMYFVGLWNKLVKTNIARKVRFLDDKPYYEDIAYTLAMYSYIDRFILVKDAYYIWDKRKRLTVGTSSEEVKGLKNIDAWKYYLVAYTECLRQGNQDSEVADVYKLYILSGLLKKYQEIKQYKEVEELFAGVIKYLLEEYKFPIGSLNNPPLEREAEKLRGNRIPALPVERMWDNE